MEITTYEMGQISLEEIKKAAQRISGHAVMTPIMTNNTLDELASESASTTNPVSLFFKCEVFQHTGSFKFRGALNAVSTIMEVSNTTTTTPQYKAVCTHSSGNHAAALAAASQLVGPLPAHIVVPTDTPPIKKNSVLKYKGILYECEPTIEAREQRCAQIAAEHSAFFIPPYNHPYVICGQGTIGLEVMEQVNGLDAIVVPVSGGGMISGIAVAAKSLNPAIKIVAAEPCGTNDAADVYASKKTGSLDQKVPKPNTICDGLQARLGSITWPIVRDLVDDVIVVTEQEVVHAMKLIYENLKVVVEPSGAVGAAAALKGGGTLGSRVGVVLCGGNVDFDSFVPSFWSHFLIRL